MYGDRERIGQVITNFLTNALKYSPRTKEINVTTTADNDTVGLSVQDFGVGLSNEDTVRIFERFYRVGGAQGNTYPGLGLGLYIAERIVHAHQGRIDVKSSDQQGTTFTIHLPLTLAVTQVVLLSRDTPSFCKKALSNHITVVT